MINKMQQIFKTQFQLELSLAQFGPSLFSYFMFIFFWNNCSTFPFYDFLKYHTKFNKFCKRSFLFDTYDKLQFSPTIQNFDEHNPPSV